ncbi:hypothetical protein F3Y22_tig00111708pilonHSYRG00087 [Hibiscus syriacus]|uniref:Transmembrane protein n=1 Tax=Hibiscus syriacus TaxID=106335 RepID=A0A6A2XG23_HIBSY|nr:hypothetical protein F3Y22_tig00111708pilonHSYRG00087 [Hibiscus syriacus]
MDILSSSFFGNAYGRVVEVNGFGPQVFVVVFRGARVLFSGGVFHFYVFCLVGVVVQWPVLWWVVSLRCLDSVLSPLLCWFLHCVFFVGSPAGGGAVNAIVVGDKMFHRIHEGSDADDGLESGGYQVEAS